ncbi:MAG: hypothetical protein Q4D04_02080 [Clostridia bacterium]|nr:hypothetical protein [Clostridia bacterium]
MDRFKTALRVCRYSLRRLITTPKAIAVPIAAFFIVFYASQDVRSLCAEYNVLASPFALFTCITITASMVSLLIVGLMLLMSDAPFIDDAQPNVIMRSGRLEWSLGQLLFMFAVSVAYWLFVAVCCFLVLLGRIDWRNEWGTVFSTLQYNPSYHFSSSTLVMANYSVLKAFFTSMALAVALSVFLLEIIYIVNIHTNTMYGLFVPLAFVFLNWAYFMWGFNVIPLHASPVSLAALNWLDPTGITLLPTPGYAAIFFTTGVTCLSILCAVSIRGKNICTRHTT